MPGILQSLWDLLFGSEPVRPSKTQPAEPAQMGHLAPRTVLGFEILVECPRCHKLTPHDRAGGSFICSECLGVFDAWGHPDIHKQLE